jgi:DNA-binding transcriptional LysR family regulator
VTVATTLNVTRSAERLHLAQSSVTEQIQALESDLGAALFERSARGLRLTAAGNRLLAYAREILALSNEARAAVAETANSATGQLSIGAPETLCSERLPAVISRYRTRCPDVQVVLRAATSGELRKSVKTGALDVCFAFGNPAADSELLSEQVSQEEVVIIVPSQHHLAQRTQVTTDDLRGEAFAVTEPGCVYRRLFEDTLGADGAPRPRLVGEFGSMGALCAVVAQGLGCAVVPRLAAASSSARGKIAAVPISRGEHSLPVTMQWRAQRPHPLALQLFLEEARTTFARA